MYTGRDRREDKPCGKSRENSQGKKKKGEENGRNQNHYILRDKEIDDKSDLEQRENKKGEGTNRYKLGTEMT